MDPELLALLQQMSQGGPDAVAAASTATQQGAPQAGVDPAAQASQLGSMLTPEGVEQKAAQDAQAESTIRNFLRGTTIRRAMATSDYFNAQLEAQRAATEAGRETFIDVVKHDLVPTTMAEAKEALGAMFSLDKERLMAAEGTIIPEILASLLYIPGLLQGGRDVAMDVLADDVGWGTGLIAAATVLPLFVTGKNILKTGSRIGRAVDMATAAKLAARHAADGGMTINAAGHIPTRGFAVGAYPSRSLPLSNAPTPEDIAMYLRSNADLMDDPKNFFGTWENTANREHVFDISRVEDDLETAMALARKNGEDAIFDLSTMTEIPVENMVQTGDILTTQEAMVRAKELIGETELRRLANEYIAERGGVGTLSHREQALAIEVTARQAVFDDQLRLARQAGETANPEGVQAARDVLRNSLDVGDVNPATLDQPRLSSSTHSTRKLTDALIADETQFLSINGAKKVNDLGNVIPSVEQFSAGAVAGSIKKGWYRNSAKAFVDVHGPEAPRFAALLSALSPRQLTTNNLEHAMTVWEAFKALPTNASPAMIKRMLGTQVGMMPSRLNNAVRVLTSSDPGLLMRMSGPKVHAFHKNLLGDVLQVTNDTWMAKLAGRPMGDSLRRKIGGEVIRVPNATYLALAGRVRETAEALTQSTGRMWTPAEVQETLWSWGKALGEEAERQGVRAASLASSLPENLVEGVEDFGQMLQHNPDILDAMDRLGLNAPKTLPMPKAAPGAIAGSEVDPKLLESLGENLDKMRGLKEGS